MAANQRALGIHSRANGGRPKLVWPFVRPVTPVGELVVSSPAPRRDHRPEENDSQLRARREPSESVARDQVHGEAVRIVNHLRALEFKAQRGSRRRPGLHRAQLLLLPSPSSGLAGSDSDVSAAPSVRQSVRQSEIVFPSGMTPFCRISLTYQFKFFTGTRRLKKPPVMIEGLLINNI